MNQPDYEILSAYLDGQVTDEERARVERLLEEDAEARRLLEELREVSQAVSSLPRHTLPDDFADQIEASLSKEPHAEKVDWRYLRRRFLSGRSIAWAAIVVFIALGLNQLFPDQGEEARQLARDGEKAAPTTSDRAEVAAVVADREPPSMSAATDLYDDETVVADEMVVAAKSFDMEKDKATKRKTETPRSYFGTRDVPQNATRWNMAEAGSEAEKEAVDASPAMKKIQKGKADGLLSKKYSELGGAEKRSGLDLAKSHAHSAGQMPDSSLRVAPAMTAEPVVPPVMPAPSGIPSGGLAGAGTSPMSRDGFASEDKSAGVTLGMTAPKVFKGGGRGVLGGETSSLAPGTEPSASAYGAKTDALGKLENGLALQAGKPSRAAATTDQSNLKAPKPTPATLSQSVATPADMPATTVPVPVVKSEIPTVENVINKKLQVFGRVLESEIVVVCEVKKPAEVARDFNKLLRSNRVVLERQIVLDRRTLVLAKGQTPKKPQDQKPQDSGRRLAERKEDTRLYRRLAGGFEKPQRLSTDPMLPAEVPPKHPDAEELVIDVDWNQAVGLLQAMEQDTKQFVSVQAESSPELELPEPVSQFNRVNRGFFEESHEEGVQVDASREGRSAGYGIDATMREYNRRVTEGERRVREALSRPDSHDVKSREKSIEKPSSLSRKSSKKQPAKQYRIRFIFRPAETR